MHSGNDHGHFTLMSLKEHRRDSFVIMLTNPEFKAAGEVLGVMFGRGDDKRIGWIRVTEPRAGSLRLDYWWELDNAGSW